MRTLLLLALTGTLAACGSIETGPGDLPATVVTVPARTVVALRVDSLDTTAIDRFADEVEKQGVSPAGDMLSRGPDLLVPVADTVEVEPPLSVTDLPKMRCAAVECEAASLAVVDRQIDLLYDWIAENGYRPVASPIRVLLAWPPEAWRVEILIPVESAR